MRTDLKNLIVYNKFALQDCVKLPKDWAKLACRYKSIRKKAVVETPPSINVLLCGILQSMVSQKLCFIEKAAEIVKGNMSEDSVLVLTGVALVECGYQEEGIKRLRRAVELNPSSGNMATLAGCIENPEDYGEKLKLANQILEKNPKDIDGLRHKAFVLMQQNRLDEAEQLVQKAIKQSPKNAAVREELGEILFRRGMFKDALATYKKAYSYFDRSKYLWQQIAICYAKLGRKRQAKNAAKKMLKIARKENPKADIPEMKKFLTKYDIFIKT